MAFINIDKRYTEDFIKAEQLSLIQQRITTAHKRLHEKTGAGNDYLGWLHFPRKHNLELNKIKSTAKKISTNSDILLVIGVGGSYLGARAAIELLTHTFHNILPKSKRNAPKVIFIGQNLSGTYLRHLFDLIDNQEVSINVISKSGTTLETAVAFRILKKYMEERYGKKEASNRIYVTTDEKKGALKLIASEENYETFVIPDNIGGRYSVLTAVGLLPIAVSGISIEEMLNGAKLAYDETQSDNIFENNSYMYAALRNILYNNDKKIELLATYEPQFHYFQEWWKQLFGESEGKEKKGLFPASVTYSTDLHSLGQYIQDGERHLFQTVLHINESPFDVTIHKESKDYDRLNYLANKTMNSINDKAFKGALLAHSEGGVPNIVIDIPHIDAFSFGYLVYFFKKACAISGYLLEVNPFDQPGVETYKRNMLNLLKNVDNK